MLSKDLRLIGSAGLHNAPGVVSIPPGPALEPRRRQVPQPIAVEPEVHLHGDLRVGCGAVNEVLDREAASENLAAFHSLDSRLNSLMEYRQFDYWIYEHHLNPIQLVAHLKEEANILTPVTLAWWSNAVAGKRGNGSATPKEFAQSWRSDYRGSTSREDPSYHGRVEGR